MIADAAGNLYGGTIAGAQSEGGTVFELVRSGEKYSERTLVIFRGANGLSSTGAMTLGKKGELFGITTWGGQYGYGTAFRVSTKGRPRERVIQSFGRSENDGGNPDAGLALDAKGALFGTTEAGGSYGAGTVFKLSPSGRGYVETYPWEFGGAGDGKYPDGLLTLGANGVLYGTTGGGGTGCGHGCGIVFELIPKGRHYRERVLYNFKGGSDGSSPDSGVTFDSSGALYGVTDFGGGGPCAGGYGCGTVYELQPAQPHKPEYTERVLWSFGNSAGSGHGYYPASNIVLGESGRLYGTTWQGGTYDAGTAYELVPNATGYSEKVLWNFDLGDDGYDPRGNLIMDSRHRLYGVCYAGGSSESPDGTVFRLTP